MLANCGAMAIVVYLCAVGLFIGWGVRRPKSIVTANNLAFDVETNGKLGFG